MAGLAVNIHIPRPSMRFRPRDFSLGKPNGWLILELLPGAGQISSSIKQKPRVDYYFGIWEGDKTSNRVPISSNPWRLHLSLSLSGVTPSLTINNLRKGQHLTRILQPGYLGCLREEELNLSLNRPLSNELSWRKRWGVEQMPPRHMSNFLIWRMRRSCILGS